VFEKTAASRIPLMAALFIFGVALVPVALGDKGGKPNGGSGGGNGQVVTTSTTATTSTTTTSSTPTSTSSTTTTSASPPTSGTLGLTSTSTWLNPKMPYWCLSEDDYDQRVFSGSLNGSYATSYRLCGLDTDGYTAGGIGLESDVYVEGQLSDVTVTGPDGSVHHAVLMGTSTSGSGKNAATTSHYAVCYVPPWSISSDTSGAALPGGTWVITLSGQIANANWTTTAWMTNVTYQQTHCPQTEQNLVP
jgi:hypothetical protein